MSSDHVLTPPILEDFIEDMGRKTFFTLVNLVLVGYLLFVTWIGPNYMKGRRPYSLKSLVIGYNLIMIITNAFLLYKFWVVSGKDLANNCYFGITKDQSYYYFLFSFSKMLELAETIIYVLRKKQSQVSLLHLFHHSTMVESTLVTYLFYSPVQLLVPLAALNSFVHVIMYSYYFLAALGPSVQKYLWWKKYLTQVQLIQFFVYLSVYFWVRKHNCTVDESLKTLWLVNVLIFTALFLKFYVESYIKTDKRTMSQENMTKVD